MSFAWTEEVLVKLASYFSEYSFKITIEDSKDPLLAVFDNIAVDQQEAIEGYIISKDPITLTAFPNVRSVSADTTVYHNEGANAVQELAYALALAAKFAQQEESFAAFSKKFLYPLLLIHNSLRRLRNCVLLKYFGKRSHPLMASQMM